MMHMHSLYWDSALYHHGIKGQKWGIRRFQNPDGSLTPLGRLHYYGDANVVRDSEMGWMPTANQKHFSRVTDKEFAREYRKTTKSPYNYEGRPNELVAASNIRAKKEIENIKYIKEEKEKLFEQMKPEIEFETNHELWKQYGYNPEDPSFSTIHDHANSYYDAKEKYMKSIGLGRGTKERAQYDKDRQLAFERYNNNVRFTVQTILGTFGSKPVTVTSKFDKIYYSTAKEAVTKVLTYSDENVYGDGALDFYALADEYAAKKNSK